MANTPETDTLSQHSLSVVMVTTPDEGSARKLARHLVSAELAACVNIVPAVTSVYRWAGEVKEDCECLCVIKTRTTLLSEMQAAVMAHHPYDTPEFVALPSAHVSAPYLAWAVQQTRAPKQPA